MRQFLAIIILITFSHLVLAGESRNVLNDDISIAESDPPVISYTLLPTFSCAYNGNQLNGVNITDATGIPLAGPNRPRIYYRKNNGSWFSQPGTFVSGTATNSYWNFMLQETDLGGVSGGDVISYYVIAEDTNIPVNVAASPSAGLIATDVNSVSNHPTSPNSFTLRYTLGGTYTVGVGGNFTTLTAAINAYNNACGISAATIFELTDNNYPAETYPISIDNHPSASSINTLTIRPSLSATPQLLANNNVQAINLTGARYVIFDGRQGGVGTTRSMTISNAGTGSTIQFINDAKNNTLRYCTLKGASNSGFSGVIVFLTSSAAGSGNDDNLVDNNEISESSATPANGIYSAGTEFRENDRNTISNNNIVNFSKAASRSTGIFVSMHSSAWTITGNRLYQTSTRLFTGAATHMGIYVTDGNGYTISNNVVGFANANGTGTTNMIGNSSLLAGFPSAYSVGGTPVNLRYIAIGCSLETPGPASNIDGNTVGGFAMFTGSNAATTAGIFCGIYVESGTVNVGANTGNIIGSTTGNNSIYVVTAGNAGTVIGIRATTALASSIQNNLIGSITAGGTNSGVNASFTGITVAGPSNYSIRNNSIGNTTPGNIRVGFTVSGGQLSNSGSLQPNLPAATGNFRGITCASSLTSVTVSENTLRGWISSCPAMVMLGIETSGTHSFGATLNVNNNLIGTATLPWIDATVSNTGFLYGINIANVSTTTQNITGNIFRGAFFGGNNSVGGGLIRLTSAFTSSSTANISNNSFSELAFNFSVGNLYLIFASYAMSSSARLTIEGNSIVENFSATGTAQYHFVHCGMSSSSGAAVTIRNNQFNNVNLATGFSSDVFGLYSSFSGNSATLLMEGNTFDDWSAGPGTLALVDVANMTGAATVTANTINNINSQGDIEPISMGTGGASGNFNISNNRVQNLVSSGAGGYINGIALIIPPVPNTSQITISNNICSGYSSLSATGIITGMSLRNGHASSTVSVRNNKIYDVMGSASGSRAYGIYQEASSAGNITYINNLIGDLRAPISAVAGAAVAGIRVGMAAGTTKLYYNTIHVSASGTANGFSTAGIFADVAVPLELRNNIFSNVSVHGSTGRSVAYWRSGSNLTNYSAASNNNLFYGGIPSPRQVIYFDGSNSDQAISTYQARVGSRDAVSVSLPPSFVSTSGADLGFLHIQPAGSCGIGSGGDNSGILLATDFDGESRRTVAPFVTDIGADEVSKQVEWTGTVSNDWSNSQNWSGAVVPNDPQLNVVIPGPPVAQPQILSGASFQVDNIFLAPSAVLTNRGTLAVAGKIAGGVASINNTPGATPEGSVKLNGNCATPQLITGSVFTGNKVKDLTVANNADISGISGEQLEISGSLFFEGSSRLLKTGDNLVMLSTANSTANVGDLTGNEVSGKVTVERYINTGLVADGRHLKGWQFLATPATGPSIYESWQENGSAPPGYGTIITGSGSGFDITTTTPSIKYFNPSANSWSGVTNTGNQIANPNGYMIFVRGDRTVTGLNQDAVPTKLRIKGGLYQPSNPPAGISVQPGLLASIGNPYASSIDLRYMRDNGLFVNLNNDVIVWDPLLYGSYSFGGYQTLSAANDYEPTAGGSAYYPAGSPSPFIQSGQAFFVRSSGAAGTVSFNESIKATGSRLVHRGSDHKQYFRASLFTSEGEIADGNAAVFSRRYRGGIDEDDARKMDNGGENFCLMREGLRLSVEARAPLSENDSLFYHLSSLRQRSYQLRFSPKNLGTVQLRAYLVDRFLGSQTLLSLHDSSIVTFDVTSDPRSREPERFFVIFRRSTRSSAISNVTQIAEQRREPLLQNEPANEIRVYPNPIVNDVIMLHFHNQPAGIYRVELINLMGQVILTRQHKFTGGNASMAIKPTYRLSTGTYRIKILPVNAQATVLKLLIP